MGFVYLLCLVLCCGFWLLLGIAIYNFHCMLLHYNQPMNSLVLVLPFTFCFLYTDSDIHVTMLPSVYVSTLKVHTAINLVIICIEFLRKPICDIVFCVYAVLISVF